jgi:hypothetical protein
MSALQAQMDRLDRIVDARLSRKKLSLPVRTPRSKTPAAPRCVTTPKPAA